MKKFPLVLALVGAVILIAGVWLQWSGGPPRADAASIAQCETRMREQAPDMVARCQESAFATAMTATDAQAAATAISNANNSEVAGNTASMFLIGLGAALLLFGLLTARRLHRTKG